MVRVNRAESEFATVRDFLSHRAHDLAHSLQPIAAFLAAATVHHCGHGDHLPGASIVVAHAQQAHDLYGCGGMGGDDDNILEHGALLSTESRMDIDSAAGSPVLFGRHNSLGS